MFRIRTRRSLHLLPDAQEIAAPELGDIRFGVTALDQLGGHVANLADIVEAFYAAAIIEIRADADMVDTDLSDRVIDGVDEILDRGLGLFFRIAYSLLA